MLNKVRVGTLPWNAACGYCQTTWLGGWSSKREADDYILHHQHGCAPRVLGVLASS